MTNFSTWGLVAACVVIAFAIGALVTAMFRGQR